VTFREARLGYYPKAFPCGLESGIWLSHVSSICDRLHNSANFSYHTDPLIRVHMDCQKAPDTRGFSPLGLRALPTAVVQFYQKY
jgi:hypothetical protein